jgi:excisionase family DNA binding protein
MYASSAAWQESHEAAARHEDNRRPAIPPVLVALLFSLKRLTDWPVAVPFLGPHSDEDLLTPREVARMLNVTTTTLGAWARIGALKPFTRTPGGHRRYRRIDILAFDESNRSAKSNPEQRKLEEYAVRLYEQGWAIRRIAEHFDCSYGKIRRILLKHTSLRNRTGM